MGQGDITPSPLTGPWPTRSAHGAPIHCSLAETVDELITVVPPRTRPFTRRGIDLFHRCALSTYRAWRRKSCSLRRRSLSGVLSSVSLSSNGLFIDKGVTYASTRLPFDRFDRSRRASRLQRLPQRATDSSRQQARRNQQLAALRKLQAHVAIRWETADAVSHLRQSVPSFEPAISTQIHPPWFIRSCGRPGQHSLDNRRVKAWVVNPLLFGTAHPATRGIG